MKYLILFSFVAIAFSACTPEPGSQSESNSASEADNPVMEEEKPISLTDSLSNKKNAFLGRAAQEKIDLYDRGIEAVAESGILETAINVGDKAPVFTLDNATGEPVSLEDYLSQGPVILTWYRGGWCPYCNITLHYLQEYLPQFKAAGANLLALTPELPDSSLSTSEKNELEFAVLSDLHNGIAKEYGIVFTLIEGVADAYQNGFGLHEYNGDESNELPLAATYVIDQEGIVRWAFLHKDYRNRAEPEDILAAVKALK